MNDLLKKLMAGLPQAEPQDMHENDPYLAPNMLPSPLMSPMESLQKENNDRIKMASFEPEEIKAQAPMPSKAMKPSLPFTQPGENLEIPQDVKKAPTLEEILANLPGQQKDNELADAQAANQDYIRAVLLARAGNKIGSSIAGVKADEKYGQDFADLSNKKVTDLQDRRKSERDIEDQGFQRRNQVISERKSLFELGDKEKENDANSDVSKAFREYMRSYAKMANVPVNIDDRMSMADLQKTTGMLGNIVSAKMAQDARRDNLMLTREAKEATKKEKSNIQSLNWGDQTAKDLIKNPYYKSYSTIKKNSQVFDAALKDPSGVMDLSALYSFVKFLDQDSAVREGEIDLLMKSVGGIDSIKQQVEKAMTTGSTARVLPNAVIKAMIKSNEVLKKNLTSGLGGEITRIEQQAGKRGADVRDAVSNYDEIKSDLDGYSKLNNNAPATEIERKTKDGKIAIYDSNKKFLRYKE